jgi:hypothetical protein
MKLTPFFWIVFFCTHCSSEKDIFVENMDILSCNDVAYPVCGLLKSHCFLDKNHVAHIFLPQKSPFRALFKASKKDRVTYKMFFETYNRFGSYHSLRIFEPGCFSLQNISFKEDDFFKTMSKDRIFSYTFEVENDGEHLLELATDTDAEVYIKITVDTPDP